MHTIPFFLTCSISKLLSICIYPHLTTAQGITKRKKSHIKIVSCVDIFLTVFGQRRQCWFVIAKNACNHRKKYSHTSTWRSQAQALAGRRDGTICSCTYCCCCWPSCWTATVKLACLAAHEILHEYVRYPHIILCILYYAHILYDRDA